ncbi:Ankyrin repeat-containing protein [Paenibacillus sp. 1_12]|uniref:ankyrin repeat domain-containing protein n=1 Tax=Paenibacillus sp. 1_12 TaxID=1566278 RepID=UPI0008EC4AF2|nr:ankyrin repeat domain-containing protein [Paenibacillus sp. 1_12]SFM37707.1 Ankyrin repeat-containing protein [Paenibacillus sp. 1_12]
MRIRNRMGMFIALLITGATLSACSADKNTPIAAKATAPAQEVTDSDPIARAQAEQALKKAVGLNWDWKDMKVIRTDYGDYLACASNIGPMIVYDKSEGKVYALNGQAKGKLNLSVRNTQLDSDYLNACLKKESNKTTGTSKNATSLIETIKSGNPDKVKQALIDKPEINTLDSAGKTALHYALELPPVNRSTIVKSLIDAGADPNLNGPRSIPALSMAATANDIPNMNLLIAAGADVKKGDWDDAPPFIYAAANNARAAIDLLLSKGENVNKADKHGLYPIDHALITGQSEMSQYLRSLGGKSALDQVKTKEDAQKLMKQAEVEATQNFLELQVFYNNIFCTKLMLKAGFPVNSTMNQTLPDLAKNGRLEMMEAILEAGADPNIVVDGRTALDEATQKGDKSAIQLLNKYREKRDKPQASSPPMAVDKQTVPVAQEQTVPKAPVNQKQPVQKEPVVLPGKIKDELPDGVLKSGTKGIEVQVLQEILIELGESIPSGADGNYGKETMEALKSFQKKNNLTADGIYGPSSKRLLNKMLIEQRD